MKVNKIKLLKKSLNHNHMIQMPGKYYDSYVQLANNRCIFIAEDVTKELASQIIAMLLYFDHQSDEMISMYIGTNGGDSTALLSIISCMDMCRSKIQTICMSKCYSAGSVLLSNGSVGNRLIFKDSKVLIHGIQATYPISPSLSENADYLKFLEKNNDNVMKILSKNTGVPLNDLKEMTRRDLWLNPEDCLKDKFGTYGLIDGILE